MRRLLSAAAIFLLLGPLPGTEQRLRVMDRTSQRIEARPLVYPADQTGTLRFVRGWQLVSPNAMFGGFSALALTGPDRFQLAGDNGVLVRMTLTEDGRPRAAHIGTIPSPAGPSPTGGERKKSQRDVESMLVDPLSGRTWLALEGLNQVWRLDPALTKIESRRALPEPAWPSNSGPEAMARLADGRTLIFSEDAHRDPRGREALLYTGDPAAPGPAPLRFFYEAEGKGLVSDAAPLPDGRVLLVHRRLGLSPIFTTILAIVDPADIAKDAVVRSVAIGQVPAPLADNYEGAAVMRRDGRTFVWLVADNNFNAWQRSLLVEFELVDLPGSKKAAR
ncbi:esterase-like activity of phytase family protein [Sphingopyxis sp. NFH-91]|uniref:esterase-like activity of phytase family protein n=1 Tax=Sphingopyxis sp. NFH-91 TaxID=2744457 RepID=UPI001F1FCEF3|nr:esterase-like activity of phytase family protein [Sphingopyxis sp. NFH-91]